MPFNIKIHDIDYLGENVDRLICIDLKARGVIHPLYEAARSLVGKPLTSRAAQLLVESLRAKEVVLITTGFRLPPLGLQETDGILGAISLAKALQETLKAKPLLLIEKESIPILKAILNVLNEKITVQGFPTKFEEAEEKAEEILAKYNPTLLVAIEKAGCNSLGEYHTSKGENVTSFHAKIEVLFRKARKNGIVTLAVGDGGNEVGMGNIKKAVEKTVSYATKCICPCQGGIAAQSKVDLLVTATVSNWGVYGILTCLAKLTQKPKTMHGLKMEGNMLKTAVKYGAIDGVTRRKALSVDGISLAIHKSLIKMLKAFPQKKLKREILI